MRRHGFFKGVFKLLFYTGMVVVALSFVYPQLLQNPSMIVDGLQSGVNAAQTGTTVDVDSISVRDVERRVHSYVNERRTEHGLDRLSYDTALASIARAYSQDMAERGFFSHYSPEGENFADRYEEAGYDCRIQDGNSIYTGGENLAQSYIGRPVRTGDGKELYTTVDELAAAIVRGWMNSPEHRDNMLKDVWLREGIGVHILDDGEVYATQNFC